MRVGLKALTSHGDGAVASAVGRNPQEPRRLGQNVVIVARNQYSVAVVRGDLYWLAVVADLGDEPEQVLLPRKPCLP